MVRHPGPSEDLPAHPSHPQPTPNPHKAATMASSSRNTRRLCGSRVALGPKNSRRMWAPPTLPLSQLPLTTPLPQLLVPPELQFPRSIPSLPSPRRNCPILSPMRLCPTPNHTRPLPSTTRPSRPMVANHLCPLRNPRANTPSIPNTRSQLRCRPVPAPSNPRDVSRSLWIPVPRMGVTTHRAGVLALLVPALGQPSPTHMIPAPPSPALALCPPRIPARQAGPSPLPKVASATCGTPAMGCTMTTRAATPTPTTVLLRRPSSALLSPRLTHLMLRVHSPPPVPLRLAYPVSWT
ncbi:MAG: hypothetical protein FD187_3172 [bacterium]|nr:MAG: hypothetical protein FD187_3172 [bacterium]